MHLKYLPNAPLPKKVNTITEQGFWLNVFIPGGGAVSFGNGTGVAAACAVGFLAGVLWLCCVNLKW